MAPQGIKPLEVELPLPVESYDIDLTGVVSNIMYIRWLEDLRLEMLDRYFPLENQIKAGYSRGVLETHIQCGKTIRMFDGPIGRVSNYHPIRIPTELRAMFAGFAREGPRPDKKPA